MIPKFRCFIDGIGIVGVKAIYFDSEQIILEPFNGVENQYIALEDVELLQSTGIININKQEIFEGDIVKTKHGKRGRHIGVVKHHGASFYSAGVKQYRLIHEELNANFEVIGNKFQHPHLLEE